MAVYKDKYSTKDGRCWRYKSYYHNYNGELKVKNSRRYKTQKEALQQERIFLLNRDKPVNKIFGDVANDYFNDLKVRVRESTYILYLSRYTHHIKPIFQDSYLNKITVLDIERWKKSIISKVKNTDAANQYYAVFYEIFKYANKKYEINYNPVVASGRFKINSNKIITDKEKLKYITYEDFKIFLSVIDNEMWYAFFTTLYFTGLRKGEILALRWEDVDFNNKTLSINKSLTYHTNSGRYKITPTKTSLNRTISMSNVLIDVLQKYKDSQEKYSDFSKTWFVFGSGDALREGEIYWIKDKYFKQANLFHKRITIHQFRHSHVSLCVNEFLKSGEVDATKFFVIMSARMGHSIPVMQNIYMHLFPSAQDEIVDLLNNL